MSAMASQSLRCHNKESAFMPWRYHINPGQIDIFIAITCILYVRYCFDFAETFLQGYDRQ